MNPPAAGYDAEIRPVRDTTTMTNNEKAERATLNVRKFLARAVDLSEKIQNRMDDRADKEEIDELYAARRALFAGVEPEVASWITASHLSAADSWAVYKEFLHALEDEHFLRQYKAQDNALGFEKFEDVHANPFLLQRDEVDDKEVMDNMIERRRLAPSDVQLLMGNFSAKELLGLMLLAKGLRQGSFWEHKYDL